MSCRPEFSAAAEASKNKFSKKDNAVLFYKTAGESDIFHYYDFVTRYLYVRFEQREHSHMIPFSDLDQETLHYMREKLIELGGTPPPLAENRRSAIQKKELSC